MEFKCELDGIRKILRSTETVNCIMDKDRDGSKKNARARTIRIVKGFNES